MPPLKGRIPERPVNCLHPVSLRVIKSFVSIAEASKKMDIAQSAISKALKHRGLCKGYKWVYLEEVLPVGKDLNICSKKSKM